MKKLYKIIFILLIISMMCFMSYNIYATDIWDIGKNFLDTGTGEGASHLDTMNSTIINDAFIELADFLWDIGLLVVIISTVVIGIKYMLVNPNEKSRIKQATTPYIIGVVIIFGALTIWKLIINVLEGSMGIGG